MYVLPTKAWGKESKSSLSFARSEICFPLSLFYLEANEEGTFLEGKKERSKLRRLLPATLLTSYHQGIEIPLPFLTLERGNFSPFVSTVRGWTASNWYATDFSGRRRRRKIDSSGSICVHYLCRWKDKRMGRKSDIALSRSLVHRVTRQFMMP